MSNNIYVDNYLVKYETIMQKNYNNITFKDVISLIFYSIKNLSQISDPEYYKWKIFYENFNEELENQNNMKWPLLDVIKNDFLRKMDILIEDTIFIKSDHILMLLLRLMYIEDFKEKKLLKSDQYYPILNYKINFLYDKLLHELSLIDFFDMLKKYLLYYIRIYDNEKSIEYKLAQNMLNQIND